MKKSLHISWNHFLRGKEPCIRSSDTGISFRELAEIVRPILENDGIMVSSGEILLPAGAPADREGIYLNGRPLIELLTLADQAEFLCRSTKCQVFEGRIRIVPQPDGASCLEAPEIFFRRAFLQALEDA